MVMNIERLIMKKVLIINTIGMGYEGISSVILNYAENMSTSDISLGIITYPTTAVEIKHRLDEVAETYTIPKKKKDLKGYILGLYKVLEQQFDVIHIHGNSGMMLIEVTIAKVKRVKRIITHCHNTKCDHPLLNKILKYPMKWMATDLMACSEAAGTWLYGNCEFKVLNNAIDVERFAYNVDVREQYRDLFGVKENEPLIGHIGSFIEQKNHAFLLDIFQRVHEKRPNVKLILVSDGPKLQMIKRKVCELGLQDNVIFAGRRSDVSNLYQAMDVFVMPSMWEGLPLVMLEAQAAGLPVIVSDAITKEAKCTSRVSFIKLDESLDLWAEEIINEIEIKRSQYSEVKAEFVNSAFDIKVEAEKLENIYLT